MPIILECYFQSIYGYICVWGTIGVPVEARVPTEVTENARLAYAKTSLASFNQTFQISKILKFRRHFLNVLSTEMYQKHLRMSSECDLELKTRQKPRKCLFFHRKLLKIQQNVRYWKRLLPTVHLQQSCRTFSELIGDF